METKIFLDFIFLDEYIKNLRNVLEKKRVNTAIFMETISKL